MGKNEFSNIDKQIREAVEDAIHSMDFKQLNSTISNTISYAVDEVRNQFISSSWTGRKPDPVPPPSFTSKPDRKQSSAAMDKLKVHPPSRVKGILLTVFGSIALSLSLLALFAILLASMFFITAPLITLVLAISLLITAIMSGIILGRGNILCRRLARLKLYLKEFDNKTYCTIRSLMGGTGKTEKFILKDLKKMIKAGILPHAHIDNEQTSLMLDDETYHQYLKSLESLQERTQAEQMKQSSPPSDEDNRLSQLISEGREYLMLLREANDAIPGEIVSAKLYRLETIIEKIFNMTAKHPEQADNMERFMEYYLPTTIKLVNAYRNFDSAGISGDNISMVKADIETTLDTINQAFEQLLDSLYQDEAFDISTDASVLQTMLRKDGYMSSDFDRRESP